MSIPSNIVNIPNGKSVSAITPVPGTNMQLVSILVPSNWTTAGLQILGSFDGINSFPVFSVTGGALLSVNSTNAAAGTILTFRFDDLTGLPYIQLQSGTTGSPVNQTATGGANLTVQWRTFQ